MLWKIYGCSYWLAKKPLDQVMLLISLNLASNFGISKSPDYLYNKLINIEEIKTVENCFRFGN